MKLSVCHYEVVSLQVKAVEGTIKRRGRDYLSNGWHFPLVFHLI